MFLKISQNAQKKETLAQVFCSAFCEIFTNTFFTEHLQATACELFTKQTSKKSLISLNNTLLKSQVAKKTNELILKNDINTFYINKY